MNVPRSLTYGEAHFLPLLELLRTVGVPAGATVVDLGSGSGRVRSLGHYFALSQQLMRVDAHRPRGCPGYGYISHKPITHKSPESRPKIFLNKTT